MKHIIILGDGMAEASIAHLGNIYNAKNNWIFFQATSKHLKKR